MRRSVLPMSLLVLFAACDDGADGPVAVDAGDARVRGSLADAASRDQVPGDA